MKPKEENEDILDIKGKQMDFIIREKPNIADYVRDYACMVKSMTVMK